MHTAFDLILFESGFLKNLRIREKVDPGSGLLCLSNLREKAILQLYHRISLLVTVMMDKTSLADLHVHIGGKRINNRRTYSMQTSTGLVHRIVKLSTCVQCGKDNAGR